MQATFLSIVAYLQNEHTHLIQTEHNFVRINHRVSDRGSPAIGTLEKSGDGHWLPQRFTFDL